MIFPHHCCHCSGNKPGPVMSHVGVLRRAVVFWTVVMLALSAARWLLLR